MVDYLIENYGCTKQERVEVLELLGAFFITHDNNSIAKCYYFLQEAMKERHKNNGEIVEKIILPPVPVYDNKIECKTLKELQEIELDPVALCMESLAARERILGLDPLVPTLLIKSGRWFFFHKSYDRCKDLWLHSLKHMQNIEIALSLDGFAEAYLKKQQLGQTVNFEKLKEVFQYAVFEIQLEKKQMTEGCMGHDDTLQFLFQRNIEICICIIAIMLREAITKAKKNDMYKVIQQLIQLKPVLANGFTVLHMCCDGALLIKRVLEITEHSTWDDSFPFASLCKTLIDCGVKVNALDNNKNSPLHILAKSASNIAAAFSTRACRSVRETLITLLENGAHIDSLNSAGESALDVATTKDVKDLIETYVELRLECLAARAINIHGVKYKNVIPPLLQNFVELH